MHVERLSELQADRTAKGLHKLMHRFKEVDVERLMDEVQKEYT